MDIISLGANCSVKYQIDLFLKNNKKNIKETNFFDWLYADFEGVKKLLDCKNIKELINEKTILIKKHNSQKSDVTFCGLNNIRSIHDLPFNYNENDINIFIDRYQRRYYRLINLIKNNNISIFIYNGNINMDDIDTFYNQIKNINQDKIFYLVVISNYDNDSIDENLIKITIKDKKTNKKYDWTNSHINWNLIFNKIFQLIKFDLRNID